MKQVIKLILGFALVLFVPCVMYANSPQSNIYEYEYPEITVAFADGNDLSEEKKQIIADEMAGIFHVEEIGTENADNIICSLFGHSTSTTFVTVTHHKAYIHVPRCRVEYYDVTTCSRCDYNEKVLLGYEAIFCCPEDLIN